MLRRRFAVAVLYALDVAALLFLRPHFVELARQLSEAHRWLAQAGPDALLAEFAAAALWLAAAWLGVGLAATLFGGLPGGLGRAGAAASRRLLPRALRQLVAGSVGVGVILAPVSAAAAAPAHETGQPASAAVTAVRQPGAGAQLPAPVWPIDVPSGRSGPTPRSEPNAPQPNAPVPAPPPGHQPAEIQPVRVRAGDSLWLIAARRLGLSADPSEVAAAWPRWYRANRAVIGDDPDLIMPGQLLTPPAASSNARQR